MSLKGVATFLYHKTLFFEVFVNQSQYTKFNAGVFLIHNQHILGIFKIHQKARKKFSIVLNIINLNSCFDNILRIIKRLYKSVDIKSRAQQIYETDRQT